MAFIKKQKLIESIEEKTTETITESVEDNLQSALLEVVADELSYVAGLNRMIELAEDAGKDDLVSALKKSRSSMKGSIAELYSKGKKILGIEEEKVEESKEEFSEDIDNSKVYSGDKIFDIISNYTIDLLGTNAANDLEQLAYSFDRDMDYTAEQIDAELDKYQIDPSMLESIEMEISRLPDARQARREEFKSDMDSDVSTLKMIIEDSKLFTFAAQDRLIKLINDLEHIEYDGRPGVVWGKNDYGKNKGAIIA